MTRPVLIVNPAARNLVRKPRLLGAIGVAARGFADVVSPRSLAELDAHARDILDRGTDSVMIIGGDGTVMTVLSALDRARGSRPLPMVALAHAGTVGTVSRHLGWRGSMLTAIHAFCNGAPRRAIEQPTLRAVTGDGVSRIGFIFATGFVARFFEKYDAAGGGLPAAAQIAARLFVGALAGTPYAVEVLAPVPCRVEVDDEVLVPTTWGVIVSSVLDDVGLHVRVTYRGGEDPARPHLVASPIGPRELGYNFPRVLAGRRVRGEGTYDGLVGRFRLDFGETAGPWIFDGDTVRSHTVEVTAGPVLRIARMR